MKKFMCLASLVALSSTVDAHHGTNGQFDASKILTLSGVVTDIAYVNPHAYVYLDVADANGDIVNWNCELRSASVLNRSGWKKEMFSNGTRLDIVGVAARRDPAGCYVETISFNGGPAIERYAQIEEGQLDVDTSRPELTPWGVPYIGGDWAAEQRLVGPISGPNAAAAMGGRPRNGGIELTESGQSAREANIQEGDNVTGRLDCSPRDFFRDWTFDQIPNGIYQQEDKIVLKYGFMSSLRTIHLDMDEHPDNIEPSWAGHSIGNWEDNVLVVDTVGFTKVITNRVTRSQAYHTVERFMLDYEKGSLTRTYEAEDPLFWKGKQSGQDVVFLSDYPYEPYSCDDRSVE